MDWPNPREHYRIMYPTAARPLFLTGIIERAVIDISEQGMRFLAAEGETWKLGDQAAGIIRFQRRDEVRVTGVVVRIAGREIATYLSEGVPLRVIIDEQRFLLEDHRGSAW